MEGEKVGDVWPAKIETNIPGQTTAKEAEFYFSK